MLMSITWATAQVNFEWADYTVVPKTQTELYDISKEFIHYYWLNDPANVQVIEEMEHTIMLQSTLQVWYKEKLYPFTYTLLTTFTDGKCAFMAYDVVSKLDIPVSVAYPKE